MRQFLIDGITISLEEDLVKELIKHYVLDDETTDPENWEENNYWCLKNLIRASFTPSLQDVGKITLDMIQKNYSEEEISKRVKRAAIEDLKIRGGSWEL